MTTFQITIPKVHCYKKNDLLGKDEIFLVMLVTSASVDSVPKIIFSGVSEILKIKKKDIKAMDLETPWIFNVEDNEVFDISFALYDKDKGNIYNAYKEEIKKIVESEGAEYEELIANVWGVLKEQLGSFSISGLLLALPEIGIEIFKEMRKDDFIGKNNITYKANDPQIEFVPEFDIKRNKTHFKVQIALKKL